WMALMGPRNHSRPDSRRSWIRPRPAPSGLNSPARTSVRRPRTNLAPPHLSRGYRTLRQPAGETFMYGKIGLTSGALATSALLVAGMQFVTWAIAGAAAAVVGG